MYFYSVKIIAAFAKNMKKMPSFSVTVLSGKCRSTNAWKRVQYELSTKSKVEVGGEMMSSKEGLGKVIFQVWGYEAPDCKPRRSFGDGEVKSLPWALKLEDMEMCEALMNLGDGVQPIFVMDVQVNDGVPTMAPKGVTFVVKARPVEAALEASTTDTLVLKASGEK